jgi:hypothetical protein
VVERAAVNRVQLFELEDQPWFPRVLRDGGTAYLALAAAASGHPALLAPKLAEALRASGETRILDLCSGGGGPLRDIVRVLARDGLDVRALLTDAYPSEAVLAAVAEGSQGRITWSPAPVDATRVPRDLPGVRTMFNAMHHFRPEAVRAILTDAVEAGRPFAAFELVGRSPLMLAGMLVNPLLCALAVPFLRPFRPAWIPLTYVVPALPLFVLFDGVVSCLRVYSPDELRALIASLAPAHRDAFTWDVGRIRLDPAPVYATYLVGVPRARSDGTG